MRLLEVRVRAGPESAVAAPGAAALCWSSGRFLLLEFISKCSCVLTAPPHPLPANKV